MTFAAWRDYERDRKAWLRSLCEEERARRIETIMDVCIVAAAVVALVLINF